MREAGSAPRRETSGTTSRDRAPARAIERPRVAGVGPAVSTSLVRFVERIPRWIVIALAALAALGLVLATGMILFARRWRSEARRAEHLAAIADTDVLTGLLNRRGLEKRLRSEVSRARRHQRPVAVAFADLRGLKTLNDRYGHETGDDVIRKVGEILAAHAREGDFCGRVGGDEYAVALVEADEAGAGAFRDRVLRSVEAAGREMGLGNEWHLTMGMAIFPCDGDTAEELLAIADRRLYAERGIDLAR